LNRFVGLISLQVEALDHTVGELEIDIEDRWFDSEWRKQSAHPLEQHALTLRPTATCPFPDGSLNGTLSLWLDVLPSSAAKQMPALAIMPPPVVEFEVRVIVYKTRDVPPYDGDPKTKTDMFFRAALSDTQDTDTHWRCATGGGSFNYRLKWDMELPLVGEKGRELTLQCWDFDFPENK
jgi:hypothetical protein